ncbi:MULTISPECIES: carboxypeptidase regulatory-like domain-containing protein [Xanthomonas]|uniref:Carboxypeptidase regulatory-like domain-containing protein n=1 Tax=Xanthomonas cucurbitae TaxID=56453 RepID=A0ABY7YC18_9XANT|nr:carboxypeptidase regulatory-like domain-containing protein [Xanthomonas cucurbitae]QHG85755.1 carboxypeptidase regulatory-like domain-containing protein [Xanthomonas cucurbitae]WDM69874.1 carboxypeptidase regulatory-like domain-containing protein [Xanthomonas cucurbitae]WDM71379.1 carboxypeptidase regulatory-like domain-containing protein [Xanthomonas cucurbitae]WDM75644.1 carboxypeptidase regulatory-like domain-containing protein [Xanthomonas cucurbitae]
MPAWGVLVALLAITLLAWWRLRRARLPVWRKATLLALQPVCAALLYCALLPPAQPGTAGTLVVATAGAGAPALQAAAGDTVIALPEAPTALRAAERMPDLATALRRHPGTTGLRIVGAGLPARDRDAARGWPLRYAAPPPVPGLSALDTPALAAPGSDVTIQGRISGLRAARLELLDPAGRRVDLVAPGADGRFRLTGNVRAAGDSVFVVRVLGPEGRVRDQATLPVSVVESPPANLWILAGAPQPELKYLRRWAHDAGLQLHTQIATGGGMQLGDAPRPLDPTTLDRSDLLIVDERALAALSRTQRGALRAAVERGLGLLLRLGGPPDAAQLNAMAELGLPVRGDGAAAPMRVGAASVPTQPPTAADAGRPPATPADTTAPAVPALERRALAPADADAVALQRAADGTPYAWWRALGRGRIGLIAVTDSYRLVLGARPALHAALWSQTLATLARAKPRAHAPLRTGWRDQRIAICALGTAARLQAPDGHTQPLLPAPDTGAAACAGLWPAQAGWYRWQDGQRRGALYIRTPTDAPALFANTQRHATLALVNTGAAPHAAHATPQPGPRWPWWLGFVLAATLLWWLERWRSATAQQAG